MFRFKHSPIVSVFIIAICLGVSWSLPGCGGGDPPAEESEPTAATKSNPPVSRNSGKTVAQSPAATGTGRNVAAVARPVPVYLDDMQELRFYTGFGSFGKHGATELPPGFIQKVRMNGVFQKHALSLVATLSGTSFVSYELKKQFQTFAADAGILKPVKGDGLELALERKYTGVVPSPLTFKVFGDGKLLWQSQPARKHGTWEKCEVGVEGVDVLRLEIVCPGPNQYGWSAWVQPRVMKSQPGSPSIPSGTTVVQTNPNLPRPERDEPFVCRG